MSHEKITSAVQRYNELLEQAKNYEDNENYQAALDTIFRAESTISKYASKSEIGNIAYLKGRLYMKMGEYKKAEDLLRKALSISKETKGALDDSRIIFTIGDLYYRQSDIDLALKYYLDALSILDNEYERATFTRSHLLDQIIKEQVKQHLKLTKIYHEMNDLEKAMEHSRAVIDLGERLGDKLTLLKAQHKLAQIEIKTGDYKSAFNRLIDVMEILLKDRKLKAKDLKIDIYYSLAEICLNQNNLEDAKAYIKKIYPLVKDSSSKLIEYNYKLGSIYTGVGSYKYAIRYFNKAIELSESSKSPLLSKILYEIGYIYYQMKEYDLSVEILKKCITSLELKNLKLEGRINLLIGKIFFFQEKFDDAIYYFNQAYNIGYNKVGDFKGCIMAKNFLGRLYYFQNKIMESLREFNESFHLLKQLMCRNNIEISISTLNKLAFITIFNIIKIKLKFYNEDKNLEFLKEAIGYLEFLKYFQYYNQTRKIGEIPSFLANNWNKSIKKILKLRNDIQLNDLKLKESLNYKEVEKIEKIKKNQINEYFTTLDKIWAKSPEGVSSFPINITQVIERFFNLASKIDKKWIILYVFYTPIDEKIIAFILNPAEKNILYGLKSIELSEIKQYIKKIEKIELSKAQNNSEELESSLNELSFELIDLFPNNIQKYLIKGDFEYITIIPHKILFKIPWEFMKINNKYLYASHKVSRHYSLDWLRTDIEKNGPKKKTILFIINPDHGAELDLPNAENEIIVIKSTLNKNFKYDEIKYLDITKENYINAVKNKSFSFLHFSGSLILNTENALKSRLKLFRHDFITIEEHIKYPFKQIPIILISNVEYLSNKISNKDGDNLIYIYRALMLSNAGGLIISPTSDRQNDKTQFFTQFYKNINDKKSVSESIYNSLQNIENEDKKINDLYWIYMGNPFTTI
ncbi:MAG: CHAT domain-containing tetratricopeptide repeat protein [Candidatus Helarchaeota archaeon]